MTNQIPTIQTLKKYLTSYISKSNTHFIKTLKSLYLFNKIMKVNKNLNQNY